MTDIPPFLAAQEAYRQGQPCDPPDMPEGDCYPGARQMWIDGWNYAANMKRNREQMALRLETLDILSDGRPRTLDEITAKVGPIDRAYWRKWIRSGTIRSERISAGSGKATIYTAG